MLFVLLYLLRFYNLSSSLLYFQSISVCLFTNPHPWLMYLFQTAGPASYCLYSFARYESPHWFYPSSCFFYPAWLGAVLSTHLSIKLINNLFFSFFFCKEVFVYCFFYYFPFFNFWVTAGRFCEISKSFSIIPENKTDLL